MRISDSVLEAHLRNVFWLGGGACGGKTTVTDLLANTHGFVAYHPEDHYHAHRKLACYQDHPAMLRPSLGWEWFFNRPIEEYALAILEGDREHFEMVILDLIKMSEKSTVVVDGHMLDPLFLKRITSPKKAAFLYADEPTIRETFFAREDKQDILGVINQLQDPRKTLGHVLDVVCEVSRRKIAEVRSSGLTYFVRSTGMPIEDTLTSIEKHFCLC